MWVHEKVVALQSSIIETDFEVWTMKLSQTQKSSSNMLCVYNTDSDVDKIKDKRKKKRKKVITCTRFLWCVLFGTTPLTAHMSITHFVFEFLLSTMTYTTIYKSFLALTDYSIDCIYSIYIQNKSFPQSNYENGLSFDLNFKPTWTWTWTSKQKWHNFINMVDVYSISLNCMAIMFKVVIEIVF